jgi:hypothetical protein
VIAVFARRRRNARYVVRSGAAAPRASTTVQVSSTSDKLASNNRAVRASSSRKNGASKAAPTTLAAGASRPSRIVHVGTSSSKSRADNVKAALATSYAGQRTTSRYDGDTNDMTFYNNGAWLEPQYDVDDDDVYGGGALTGWDSFGDVGGTPFEENFPIGNKQADDSVMGSTTHRVAPSSARGSGVRVSEVGGPPGRRVVINKWVEETTV